MLARGADAQSEIIAQFGTALTVPVARRPPARSFPNYADCQQVQKVLALNIVKKGLLALLMFVLVLQAGGFSCGIAAPGATIKAPCCGGNCPGGSSSTGQTCCQAQDSTGVAALSAKPSVATFQALVGSIQNYSVIPLLKRFERLSVFHASPPGALQLTLLCSRQI